MLEEPRIYECFQEKQITEDEDSINFGKIIELIVDGIVVIKK